MSVRIQTSQNVELEYEPASLGDRILATIIDRLIYLGWAIAWFGLFSLLKLGENQSIFFIVLTIVLPVLLYPLLAEYFLNGQTLGKRAMNIRVVRLDGNKPTLSAYLLRWLMIIVDTGIFTPLVAIIAIAANGKGQRIGDIAAGTSVIKTIKRVKLSQVVYQQLPEDYKVTYPQASQLNDRDIETIRQVLRKRNEELSIQTAEKVSNVLNIENTNQPRTFLLTIVNDYTHLAAQENS
ncbi:RDD family protein [Runella sp.]|uniref:RDD family protein n=1 Tax=Runella sp. TaxID=1960881 RepID=UPI003D14E503